MYINMIWQLYDLYMRNNKLVGSLRHSRQPYLQTIGIVFNVINATARFDGDYVIQMSVWRMMRVGSDAIHYGNNDFSGAFVRSMSQVALGEYSGSRVCIIVNNDASASRCVLCKSKRDSYRLVWSCIDNETADEQIFELALMPFP